MWRGEEYTWHHLRRAMQDEVALHCEQTLVSCTVPGCLHALEKIPQSLGRYCVVAHHGSIMLLRSLSDNPVPYASEQRKNPKIVANTRYLSG